MNRFFVDDAQISKNKGEIRITGEDVKHISKVLRLVPGDMVEICDGQAFEYIGEISDINKDRVIVSIKDKRKIKTEPPIKITLYQGIPKATKMDIIIQKTTEMGISEIVPVFTGRTVVQLESKKDKEKKAERWNRICLEASKQSKRGIVPPVHIPMSFQEALFHSKANEINIMAYEKESKNNLKDLLHTIKEKPVKKIGIWIGPEGGFAEDEVNKAIGEEVYTVTLGPRILRTETAGFALLSMIMYELGDLGGS